MYFNDVEYELPTRTMALQKKIDKCNGATTSETKFSSVMDFLVLGLGKEKVEEILGTYDYNKVDLNQMMLLYNDIVMEYDNIIQKPQMERLQDILKDMQLDNLVSVANKM